MRLPPGSFRKWAPRSPAQEEEVVSVSQMARGSVAVPPASGDSRVGRQAALPRNPDTLQGRSSSLRRNRRKAGAVPAPRKDPEECTAE